MTSPVLLRGETLEPRPLFWASPSNGGRRAEAMRKGPWKLVVKHPGATPGTFENPQPELYHLGRDLAEANDLTAEHPDRVATMRERLTNWFEEVPSSAPPQPGGW